jgi:hypothetical protein
MAYFKVLSRHLRGAEKTHRISQQDTRFPGRYLNRAPSEYESRALPLQQSVWLAGLLTESLNK